MYLLTGFLGLISIVSPYMFGYSTNSAALWASLIVGAVLIVASILEGIAADKERWEYWVIGAAGVGAVLAPFALGFSTLASALWALVIIGLATILAAWIKLYPWRTQYR
ncbi:SPW repeat protein [Candidatus Daviesbacteria bacterium]|nr:SPW repeat protein [Candidatus Daviesbacteria bacterium]